MKKNTQLFIISFFLFPISFTQSFDGKISYRCYYDNIEQHQKEEISLKSSSSADYYLQKSNAAKGDPMSSMKSPKLQSFDIVISDKKSKETWRFTNSTVIYIISDVENEKVIVYGEDYVNQKNYFTTLDLDTYDQIIQAKNQIIKYSSEKKYLL